MNRTDFQNEDPSDSDEGVLYLLNAAVLTAYGVWKFEGPLTVEGVRGLLSGGFVSAVGHPGVADFLSRLLEIAVPYQRIAVELRQGDRAIVFRLKERLPEGQFLDENEMESVAHEFGVLTRIT